MKFIYIAFIGFISLSLKAQNSNDVLITLKIGEAIPTVNDIYQEGQLSSPPTNHLLTSFNTAAPIKVDYLMQLRAYGDLKELINQKPNWNRAKYERSLLLSYDANADMPSVESVLNSDEYIDTVSVMGTGKLSNQSAYKNNSAGNNNWHLNAVNWYGAKNITDGFGNIGVIDTGSLSERNEFTTFDQQSGFFVGGGFVKSKSYSTYYQDRDASELREINENRLVFWCWHL